MPTKRDDMLAGRPDALRRKLTFFAASVACGAAVPLNSASAELAYPNRPLSFICPWPLGGSADVTMRVLAKRLARELGQTVHFRNVAGSAGMLGAHAIASAKPDGYTIGQIPISVTRFALLEMLTHDPLKDFSYLARTSGQTFGIVVKAESPFRTLAHLLEAGRARPGVLTYASAGIAGASHVGMEELLLDAGVRMQHVAYKGGAPALTDLLGGQVDVLVDSGSWAADVKKGRLRLLAIFSPERLKAFPHVPCLKELGFNIVVEAPNGIGAPAGLAPNVSTTLRAALRNAVLSPEFKQACDRIHAPVLYQDALEYRLYVLEQHVREKQLLEKLNLREKLSAA